MKTIKKDQVNIHLAMHVAAYMILLTMLIVTSCKMLEGPEGLNSLINVVEEPKGVNCTAGGQKIETGLDKNRNNQLEESEVQVTQFFCIGNNYETQIRLTIQDTNYGPPSGESVPYGNQYVSYGLPYFDKNNYKSVDSIILVAEGIKTRKLYDFETDIEGKTKIELFDVTNNQVIQGSAIVSDDSKITFSSNLINNLPNETITLSLKYTCNENFISQIDRVHIFLFRRN